MKLTSVGTKFFFALFFVLGLALAAGTPAGTEIRNQASAKYTDSSGQPQTTTSNEVVTVVQPVYGFTITPDGTETAPGQIKTGLQGAPVYFNYVVTNTGNVADTIQLTAPQGTADAFDFGSVKIYHDTNCNGTVDPGEVEVTSVSLDADASTCVIVEAVIPAGEADGNTGHVNLSGASAGDPAQTDTANWARAVVTSQAVLDAAKGSSPSGAVVPGATIDYAVQGSNKGGSAAGAVTGVVSVDGTPADGLLVADAIPAHTTYVLGSASGTAGAGSVSVIYKVGGAWTATEPASGSDVSEVGLLIAGAGAFFPQGAQYQLGFQVTVDAGTPAGTTIENTATVSFDANGDGDGGDTGEQVESNTTRTPVGASRTVLNGPAGDPDSDGTGFVSSYTDPSGTTWTYGETTDTSDPRNDDAQRINEAVHGGDVVYFKNTLTNGGNVEDSYTLDVSGVPAGWTCQIMAADGTTPLANPVGPLAAGAALDYVVKCSIPASATTASDTDLTVRATSDGDPAVWNETHDVVPPVQSGYALDLAKDGASADADPANDNPAPAATDPGATAYYGFEVANTGQNPDTYDLGVTVPAGMTPTIYPDPDCDGILDSPAPAPVTDTGLINPGTKACFVLAVEVPAGTPPLAQDPNDPADDNVTITATSNADPAISDTITTDLTVNPVADLRFTPDRNGTVTSPGTIVYAHTVSNLGNEAASVTFAEAGSTHPTWTYQISTDGGATWTDVASAAAIQLAPGASQEVQLRVIVPDGEPIGAIDTNRITANADYPTATDESASVTDTTTVVGGDLRIEKRGETCADAACTTITSADASQAEPGEFIRYTVTASNIGTADLKKVIVSDPLPGHTDFVSVSASTSVAGAQLLFSTDGTTWSPTAPTTLATGQAVFVALDSTADGVIDENDLLAPGESITLVFTVQVQ
ncbi:DUF11 domain-containing protein [Oceanithermus sp.]|uniref:DUF11 domain-containing protein n=1 Tax=Oceanithermus sp. TaxID=2268145 RepID=UPI00257B4DBD|nr:DUF11 domain-containing protein [Oceanithermus sp.]